MTIPTVATWQGFGLVSAVRAIPAAGAASPGQNSSRRECPEHADCILLSEIPSS